MNIIEWLKVILLGIVEGITEWLPISSTGHMILVDEFIKLNVTADFKNVFEVVIQLGAILAVVVIYFWDLWPFHGKSKAKSKSYFANPSDNKVFAGMQNFVDNYCYLDKIIMWFKIVVSCLPAAVIGLAFNDWIEAHLMNYVIVALMLIIYGVLFIIIENYNKTRTLSATKIKEITWKNALYIGVFQLLSIVPGTSRSGATIIGGILLGCSRELASEYTFFLAVPVMFGASLLKLVKHGFAFTGVEVAIMIVGMLVAFVLALILHFILKWETTWSMLFSLTIGFFVTATLENALIRRYFVRNSNHYRPVLQYFRKYWKLIFTNFLYILGLYIHNFVFWTTDMRMEIAKSFVCNQPYDMASCLAMFTNISATIIFIARVEMNFHEKYKLYSEAVIGGKGADIDNAKKRMFRQLSSELMTLARLQFIISVVVYLICVILLPGEGFSGMTLKIYPSLAVGYFILFLMYAEIIFLYYFDDLTGAIWTAIVFCLVTWIGSLIATHLPVIWYGAGVIAGAFAGWSVAYARLRWVEKNMDRHVFCRGNLIPQGKGKRPSGMVYERKAEQEQKEEA